MTQDIELLPCPVCGSAFKMGQEPQDNGRIAGMFYIYHDYGQIGSDARKCPVEVARQFDTREEAIAAWNRRTPDKALLDRIEELGAAIAAARKEARKGKPDPDKIWAILDKALSGEKQP